MRTTVVIVVALAVLALLSGVLVFHYGHDLSWLDALYFTVTIMTTVGFGDINLQHAAPGVKVFGTCLMLASAGLMAAMFGLLTDYLVKTRLEQLLGLRKIRMRNHVVLCGLGHVGIRVLEQLRKLGEDVVAIEQDEQGRFVDEARELNVPLITGDMRRPATLERANIREARSLIAASDNDLANLEAALNARELRPDIRVVLRIFDHNLASKIRNGFGIKTTFSTSALAAPAFAMAAVDPAVAGSFYIGDDLVLIMQLVVAAGSKLDGITVEELKQQGQIAVLCHECGGSAVRTLHPPLTIRFAAGDKLVLSVASAQAAEVRAMNRDA